jgi:hypothetical protein
MVDLTRLTSVELLAFQARIADELRSRQIARTSNNVTGDLPSTCSAGPLAGRPLPIPTPI